MQPPQVPLINTPRAPLIPGLQKMNSITPPMIKAPFIGKSPSLIVPGKSNLGQLPVLPLNIQKISQQASNNSRSIDNQLRPSIDRTSMSIEPGSTLDFITNTQNNEQGYDAELANADNRSFDMPQFHPMQPQASNSPAPMFMVPAIPRQPTLVPTGTPTLSTNMMPSLSGLQKKPTIGMMTPNLVRANLPINQSTINLQQKLMMNNGGMINNPAMMTRLGQMTSINTANTGAHPLLSNNLMKDSFAEYSNQSMDLNDSGQNQLQQSPQKRGIHESSVEPGLTLHSIGTDQSIIRIQESETIDPNKKPIKMLRHGKRFIEPGLKHGKTGTKKIIVEQQPESTKQTIELIIEGNSQKEIRPNQQFLEQLNDEQKQEYLNELQQNNIYYQEGEQLKNVNDQQIQNNYESVLVQYNNINTTQTNIYKEENIDYLFEDDQQCVQQQPQQNMEYNVAMVNQLENILNLY